MSAGFRLPNRTRNILITVSEAGKVQLLDTCRRLASLGYNLFATGGTRTYLVGLAHVVAASAALVVAATGLRLRGPHDQTRLALGAAAFGYGIPLTLSQIVIRRYYLLVTFPLEQVWLARMGLRTRVGSVALVALFVAQLAISVAFLGYVHVNDGAPEGDYGTAFRAQQQ
jgi:hypothetical protein